MLAQSPPVTALGGRGSSWLCGLWRHLIRKKEEVAFSLSEIFLDGEDCLGSAVVSLPAAGFCSFEQEEVRV